jgi:hypothetical protein
VSFVTCLVANLEGPFGGSSYEVFIKLLNPHLATMALVHQVQVGMVQTYLQHNKGGANSENTPSQHGSPMVEDEQKGLIASNMQHCMCCDPSFGLMTKTRVGKGAS